MKEEELLIRDIRVILNVVVCYYCFGNKKLILDES